MLINNLLLAFRLIRKDIFFSLIIVSGLAISYAAFHVLWLYATKELKSDQYHPDAERVYRVYYNWRYTDDGTVYKNENWATPLFVCGPWMKNHYPEVEEFTRVVHQLTFNTALVGHTPNVYFAREEEGSQRVAFKEEKVVYADANLFRFFEIPLILGDKRSVLKDVNSLAISVSVARKYFGDNNPLGKIILLNGTDALKVTGVFKDLPSQTHLQFDMVISDVGFAEKFTTHNFSGTSHLYVRLRKNASFADFSEKIRRIDPDFWAPMKFDLETGTTRVQPLADVAFTDGITEDNFQVKSKTILTILKLIAIFILVMGWINYVNLTFSRVLRRMKELATRKSFGAGYRDFFQQFLAESVLLNVVAVVLAIVLIAVSAGPMETYIKVPASQIEDPLLILFYAGILIFGCVLTGLYPTVIANSFGVQSLYKSNAKAPGTGRRFVSAITVFQYAVSMIMIIWVFVMNLQVNYVLHAETGMNKDQVVVIDGPLQHDDNYVTEVASLGNELRKIDGVLDFTASHTIPGDATHPMTLLKRPGKNFNAGLLTNGGVDENFLPFYGIALTAGRNFSRDMPSAKTSLLISEHGLERLGFVSAEDAVGQRVIISDWNAATEDTDLREIVGVFREYKLSPYLKTGLKAEDETGSQGLILSYKTSGFPDRIPNRISIRVQSIQVQAIMKRVEEKYMTAFPNSFFHWYFLDAHYNRAYETQQNFSHQILLFTLLAIFVASLGLLGSTSFLAVEKVKELGIRKVLGADWLQLGFVMIKATANQILLSIAAGIPLGYYFVNEYLQQYTLKLELLWWYFLIPVLLLSLILLITVLPILLRTIRVNPVRALKYT